MRNKLSATYTGSLHATRKQIDPRALTLNDIKEGQQYIMHMHNNDKRFVAKSYNSRTITVLFSNGTERTFTLGDVGLAPYTNGEQAVGWNSTNYVTPAK